MKNIFYYTLISVALFSGTGFAEKAITLQECKTLALQNNNSIKNSYLEIESADKIKKSAFTKYFPQISGGGMAFKAQDPLLKENLSVSFLPGVPIPIEILQDGKIAYLKAEQPVFAGGRIFNSNRLASLSRDVNILLRKQIQDDVLVKTEEQYWQIISLTEKITTVKKYEEFLDKLLRKVEDSFNAGISLKNDVLKVRQKKTEIELNKSKLENGIQLSTMAFCQYIGIEYDTSIVLADKLVIQSKPDDIHVNNSDVIAKRVEYQLLKKSLEAEELKTDLKIGEYMPLIGVGVMSLYTQFDNNKWTDNKMAYFSASVPISDWWGGTYSLQERNIRERMEKNNKTDKIELLNLQMEKAWKDVQDAYKQLSLSSLSRDQAEDNFNISMDSYNNGIVDLSDLLEAEAIYHQSESRLIDAKVNYRINEIHYLQVTAREF